MNWWETKTSKSQYDLMIRRHRELWIWVEDFVASKKIKSIFEVGCGLVKKIKDLVSVYQAVDINRKTDAIHDDFTKMDVSPYAGKFDLLLALGVVEHCDGYKDFLEQVIKLKPKDAIISFFWGLNREYDRTMRSGTKDTFYFWYNKYSQVGVEKELERLGILGNSQFITLTKRDTILWIKL